MFRHILVPLDGSSRAEQALPVAARLALASGGSVVLVCVVSPRTEFIHYRTDPGITRVIDTDLESAGEYLRQVSRSSGMIGVRVQSDAVFGQAAGAILTAVESHAADLIVMCSHGYTGMTRWTLGSVAEKVAHHASVPLLLLRDGGPVPADPQEQGAIASRALVPLDGSAEAKAAIVPAARLIAAWSAPGQGALHLTRVVVSPGAEQSGYGEQEAILQDAKQYLDATAEQLRAELVASPAANLTLSVTCSVTVDDDIAAGIIRVAENGVDTQGTSGFGRAGVIAMATHGHSGLQRWAMGSITERVLHATRLPLLIVRSQDSTGKGHLTL